MRSWARSASWSPMATTSAQVEKLKSRFPAMALVAAGGIAAAAVAAELDAQYVKDLLLDEPQAPAAGSMTTSTARST